MEADEVDQWILRIKDLSETAEGNLDSPNGSEFAVKNCHVKPQTTKKTVVQPELIAWHRLQSSQNQGEGMTFGLMVLQLVRKIGQNFAGKFGKSDSFPFSPHPLSKYLIFLRFLFTKTLHCNRKRYL